MKLEHQLEGARPLLFIEFEPDSELRDDLIEAVKAARRNPAAFKDIIDTVVLESNVVSRIRTSVGKPLSVLGLTPNTEGDLLMAGVTTVLDLWCLPIMRIPEEVDLEEVITGLLAFDGGAVTCH